MAGFRIGWGFWVWGFCWSGFWVIIELLPISRALVMRLPGLSSSALLRHHATLERANQSWHWPEIQNGERRRPPDDLPTIVWHLKNLHENI